MKNGQTGFFRQTVSIPFLVWNEVFKGGFGAGVFSSRFIFQGCTHLIDRLKAERCEHCDKTTQLQIHHI
ncbi:hypothetical protein OC713_02505, partial [Sweet potato little leaf phytoplasma]|uniref:hypothetical protein n=1 Tax=Candidatus Phytoplasma australasiaticum TaxID=2754999 RepID=UPI0027137ABB